MDGFSILNLINKFNSIFLIIYEENFCIFYVEDELKSNEYHVYHFIFRYVSQLATKLQKYI
jgi:hypothetical protein